jgi:hypothetical protein
MVKKKQTKNSHEIEFQYFHLPIHLYRIKKGPGWLNEIDSWIT